MYVVVVPKKWLYWRFLYKCCSTSVYQGALLSFQTKIRLQIFTDCYIPTPSHQKVQTLGKHKIKLSFSDLAQVNTDISVARRVRLHKRVGWVFSLTATLSSALVPSGCPPPPWPSWSRVCPSGSWLLSNHRSGNTLAQTRYNYSS